LLPLDKITDIEVLRQAAQLLEAENRRLHVRIAQVLALLAERTGADEKKALQLELEKLQRQLALRNDKLFGTSSSEKRGDPRPPDPAKKPKTGHGRREQPKLPVVERLHELDEGQRGCPKCGGELEAMKGQCEESEEITVVARRFELVQHKRQKYRCRCNECVVTAPAPPKLFEGARYSIDFAVGIAVDKYLDHMPLERQCRAMKREGLEVDSQTLWNYLDELCKVIEPLRPRLREVVLSQPVVHADETRWRKMAGKGEQGSEWWYDWTVCSKLGVYHHIDPSRSAEAAREILGGYRGTVVADGYGAYGKLARDGPGFRLGACWTHARRKLIEAEKSFPQTKEVLDLIADLYRIESAVEGDDAEALARRARARDEKSRPVVEQIWQWGQRTLLAVLPSSSLAEAIGYMVGQWSGLKVFLDDARVPIDNNFAERSLRGVVLGRKNHYGSRSERGTEVTALMYSVAESCKLHKLDMRAYLRAAVLARLQHQPMLLPHEFAAAMQAADCSRPA
jgi:transposase